MKRLSNPPYLVGIAEFERPIAQSANPSLSACFALRNCSEIESPSTRFPRESWQTLKTIRPIQLSLNRVRIQQGQPLFKLGPQ